MTPADFLAAVNAVAGHSTNDFSHHSCPDQRVARLVNGDWTDPDRVNLPAEREPGQRVLHIVLKSPHKHEFGPAPGFAPKGPAMNTTGKNIQKCLNSHTRPQPRRFRFIPDQRHTVSVLARSAGRTPVRETARSRMARVLAPTQRSGLL